MVIDSGQVKAVASVHVSFADVSLALNEVVDDVSVSVIRRYQQRRQLRDR